jgi:hypothetical protein
MKRTMSIFGAILFASLLLTSCGAGKWDELAKKTELTSDDVQKAIEIGTKMGDCFKLESTPGAMDTEMLPACDPFMKEYKDYCVKTFGSDDFHGDKPENKKVEGFREIMFDTRDEAAKAKQKK